ncbi:MAG TPA: glycosyltransferase family 39 protein [Planctomycetota bacterium]|nr:glycosyltransferase family 39 protein [Planctomycetota bacterium]
MSGQQGSEEDASVGRAAAPGSRWLLWLGLVFLGAALVVELLWRARAPMGEGMAFAVRGLRVELSPAAFTWFAAGVALLALGCVAVAALALRRALASSAAASEGEGAAGWRWRVPLATLLLLATALPLGLAVGWADGRVELDYAFFNPSWYRCQFFRALGLAVSLKLFWLAALLPLTGYLLVGGWRWPAGAFDRLLGWLKRLPRPLLVGAAGGAVVASAAAFSLKVLDGQPHFNDATAYFFQAKTFASGRLTSPSLGLREFLDPALCPDPAAGSYAFVGDRFFCIALPGAPLLYAVGILLGCPWLVAPLLGGGIVVATYFLAKEAFGATAALVSLPLAALSPWLILMSGEYLTHVPCALALTVFLVAALRAMARSSWRAGAVAGLFLGIGVAIRPVTAFGLGLPAAVAWGVWLVRRPGAAWRPTVAFALALALPVAGVLFYNAATTGSATTFAYRVSAAEIPWRRPEARDWRWRPPVGLSRVGEMAYGLNSAVFRWPVPELGLVLGLLLVLGRRQPSDKGRAPLIVALSILTQILVYASFGSSSEAMGGPRYVFETLPLIIVLAAGAIVAVYERAIARGVASSRARATLFVALAFCSVYAWARVATTELAAYRTLHSVDVRLYQRAEAQVERPALIFVRVLDSSAHTCKFYAAVSRNAPALEGPILYARDLGPKNGLLAAKRPGRHHYRLDLERSTLEAISVPEAPRPE